AINSGDRRIRTGRHGAHIFHIAQEAGEVDMGGRTSLSVAHGNEHISGAGEAGIGAIDRCADATWPLDFGGAGKQYLVGRGCGQPSGRESVPAAVLHQLQPEEGLVYHLAADADSELASGQWQPMDGAVWRWNWKNHEARIPARLAHRTVLWHPRSSHRNTFLEHAAADCVLVSQVK